ncbi:bifunctional polysaccharide deacetylase/glycosyltransferase family 2 protein [Actinomadura parmotrematis]|uniref:Bifunctional polysaccharide deacetylase/glycosyltransferase family 2 protein n=1 Tax=Actinomadura parmotrematis TaxID=2864039 RepID=A0ABS7G1L5_9ACTN|nr:bifunctional polysaccharide deacetylase/glycosyltransferase family 2 protein [Actinomadura parmotrematis]MBW8486599.1 bifunctional polysaccharide deacetylase/glycosyltransferase family 2 protein [Actinomadura parmotrematis]
MARRRPGAPGVRWVIMALVALAFGCVLAVNGIVTAGFGADGKAGAPGGNRAVPAGVAGGGPIVDTAHGPPKLYRVPDRTLVLTFDDGPDPRWTPRILEVLRRHRVPATFFVVGSAVARHPGVARQIRAAGGEIGLHTFTHADLSAVPDWRVRAELSQSQLAVAGALGVTSSLVRPPYSSTTAGIDDGEWRVLGDLGAGGYTTVLTTLDSEDWRRPGVDRIVANATPRDGRGQVLLFHDAGGDRAQTVEALDRLIPRLQARGYRFSTVAGAMRQPTVNPAAAPDERRRGGLLLTTVSVAAGVTDGLALLLLVVGALMVARLLLMLAVARRHVRSRRGHSWGPPVTGPATVIVPAYNESACIADTVRSLKRSRHPIEIIVVDDGSTDGTADIAEGLGLPGVRVLRRSNGGKPSALNAGIAAARTELVVMMDGDTVFTPDTVGDLVQPFADPDVGAVAGNAKVANRRGLVARFQHIEYVIGFSIDRRVYDLARCMPTVPGAVGAFRRSALHEVGGVSDDTLAEDTDLTMALVRAGWWVVCRPDAVAWTEAPATLGQLWRQRYRWSYGTMQSMWKHRRAVVERGPSGRFGRLGLAHLALFQVLLPLLAPLVDVLLLYGLLFLDPVTTAGVWLGVLGVQLAGAAYAFRLDREPLRALWALPVQQFVYRQLMYAVLIQSMITAVGGMRLRWHKLQRTGGLGALVEPDAAAPAPRR